MLADSGLLRQFECYAFSPAGQPMCVFGDPAISMSKTPKKIHVASSKVTSS